MPINIKYDENVDVATKVTVSGNYITLPATQVVKISGELLPVTLRANSSIKAGYVQLTNESGGSVLSSGVVKCVSLKNPNTSGNVWINQGATVVSGVGFLISTSDPPIKINVDSLDDIYAVSELSGDFISFIGEVA